ncbi:MAG TPA: hypothetical protein V6D50_14470 [Chroococcales cyanobacterium]
MPTRQICGCLITPTLAPALQMDVDFLKDMKAAAGRSPSAGGFPQTLCERNYRERAAVQDLNRV